jgi:hypothetical protein
MKKLNLLAAAAALMVLAGNSMAQTNVTSSAFSVSVALTATCDIKTNPGALNFGTYVPFTQAQIDRTTHLVFRCSQGLAPTQVALATSETAASVSAAGSGAATASGVLRGLQYTLTTSSIAAAATAATIQGTAAAAGAAGAAGTNSVAKEWDFTITGTMAGGQSGATTTLDNTSSHSYTMVVTY